MKRLRRFRYYGAILAVLLIAWVASYLCMRWQALPHWGHAHSPKPSPVFVAAASARFLPSTNTFDFHTPNWLNPYLIVYRPLQEIDLALTDRQLSFNKSSRFLSGHKLYK